MRMNMFGALALMACLSAPALAQEYDQDGVQHNGNAPLTLEQRMATLSQHSDTAVVVIHVAAGQKEKANFHDVFPIIRNNEPAGLTLVADESTGSYMSATAVCLGFSAAAIVQMDAAQQRATSSDRYVPSSDPTKPQNCSHEMVALAPLYPYYGFWIVRKDSPYSNVHKMLVDHPDRGLVIADGELGSGAITTLKNLLSSNKKWSSAVNSVKHIGSTEALDALLDQSIDAFFVMDALNSNFILNVVDKYNGGGKFKFLTINPYDEFFAMRNNRGNGIYQKVSMPSGHWFGSIDTISTDAELIANERFKAANPSAMAQFRVAVQASINTIRKNTGTPSDWVPASRLR